MAESGKRVSHRGRTLLSAKIMLANGNSVIDCMVRDLSSSGARIRVDEVAVVPARFDILIGAEGRNERCQVVWRRPTEIGVSFA